MAYIYDDTHTYTGQIVSFVNTTGKAQVTTASIPLTASQEFNGYSFAWLAGEGKNKLPKTKKTSGVINDVAVTVNEDGSITLDGTASGDVIIGFPTNPATIDLPNASYTLSGGLSSSIYITLYDGTDNTGTRYNNMSTAKTFTLTSGHIYAPRLVMQSGAIANNVTIYPMLRLSSTTSDWEPYENYCPINGTSSATFFRAGKNLLPPNTDGSSGNMSGVDVTFNANGTISLNGTASSDIIINLPKFRYTLNLPNASYTLSGGLSNKCYITLYNGPDGTATRVTNNSGDTTFTVSEGCVYYPRLVLKSGYVADHVTVYPMIRLSSDASNTYKAYKKNAYGMNWYAQIGFAYFGSLDGANGTITLTHKGLVFDGVTKGMKLTNVAANSGFDSYFAIMKDGKVYGSNVYISRTDALADNAMCTSMQYLDYDDASDNARVVFRNTTNATTLQIRLMFPSRMGLDTIEKANQYLNDLYTAGRPVSVVYPLEDQQTRSISTNVINVLYGENNLWSSVSGNISVTVSDVLHDFQGWLLKVGPDMTLVPTTMIKAESYKVTPNQRMEESAERDSSGVLWRETVSNMPPKIEFNTPAASGADVNALNTIFRMAFSNEDERKLQVAFYDPEENVYKTWECYMPNIDFPIRTIDIDAKTILYDEIRYAFIGY